MRKLSLLLLIVLYSGFGYTQNGTELVEVTDMLKIKTVGNISVSQDGSRAAFTVTSINPDENKLDYKYTTQIYSVATSAPSSPTQLTTAKEGASQPAWSPDGKQLAFVRAVSGKPQIFLLSLSGGEPRQITNFRYGAAAPKWSPDGRQILFSSSISIGDLLKDSLLNRSFDLPAWPSEKPGFQKNDYLRSSNAKPNPSGNIDEIRAYLAQNEIDKKAIVLHKLNFQNELNLSSDLTFNHFFLVNIDSTSEPAAVTKGFYSFTNAQFTPDGKQIIFSGDVDSLESPDKSLENEIFIANSDGSNFRLLLGDSAKTYNSATLSPSGKWLALLIGNTWSVEIPKLAIMPLRGTSKDLTIIPFDRTIANLAWSNDEKYVYFTAPSNGGIPFYRLTVATKKVDALTGFDSGITSFGLAGNKIIFSKTQVINPSELFIADALMKNEKQLSAFNDWVKSKKLSIPQKGSFTNDKGMLVEYWVMKPTNFQQGQTYPLLLEIHGGPSAMWGPGEPTMWHEYQYFCSRGYGIVYSNPRGSGGYGEEFLRGNIQDWSKGPASDVLTALDKAVAEGWADTKKLMITGGSYAGYLTAWIIAHDKRFAAACSQRGVYDLQTFFGEGNAWRLVPIYFGGYPWEPKVKEILDRESPSSYVHNITTPYIIFHGGNDRRTGFVQAEMMYRSLKVLNRPVEFVVHPGASHEITRSGDNRQRIDQMLRTYEFFERWINKK